MTKEFYISIFLIEDYALKKKKQLNRFLILNSIIMGSGVSLLYYFDKLNLWIIIPILTFELLISILIMNADQRKHLENIKVILGETTLVFINNSRDNAKPIEIEFRKIGKIKKDEWGISIFKKLILGSEEKALIEIPNVLENFELFERNLLLNCPDAKKKGFDMINETDH